MADSEPPNMNVVGKKRTFTTITTTANNLIKKCKNALDEDKLAILVEGLEEATREFLSIMLEKVELPEIIDHTPKAQALYELDISGLFSLEKPEIEQAKVSQTRFFRHGLWVLSCLKVVLDVIIIGKSSYRLWASKTNGPKVGTKWKTNKNGPARFL